jgi:hypothetical protein
MLHDLVSKFSSSEELHKERDEALQAIRDEYGCEDADEENVVAWYRQFRSVDKELARRKGGT